MLWNLYIENIAVAKQLEISFREGFTVITGQTGAGMSATTSTGARDYPVCSRTVRDSCVQARGRSRR